MYNNHYQLQNLDTEYFSNLHEDFLRVSFFNYVSST